MGSSNVLEPLASLMMLHWLEDTRLSDNKSFFISDSHGVFFISSEAAVNIVMGL